jgi:hypothetical protein
MPSSIVATQVAQVAPDQFQVRIIPDAAIYKPEQGEALKEHLHDYLGRSVRIEVKLVESIRPTRGGKMPAMVNECNDPTVRNAITQDWNHANTDGG